MERKTFLKFIGASVAAGSLITFIEACQKSSNSTTSTPIDFTLDISTSANSALQTSGGSVVSNSVIVINNGGTYVAMSDICTHQGCSVAYDPKHNQLNCPCHGAAYDIGGKVLVGPAQSPLTLYTVTKNGNMLHIVG